MLTIILLKKKEILSLDEKKRHDAISKNFHLNTAAFPTLQRLHYQTPVSYQKFLLLSGLIIAFKLYPYWSKMLFLDLVLPLSTNNRRKKVPCGCCNELVSAKRKNQCTRCKQYLHDEADNVHFPSTALNDKICQPCQTKIKHAQDYNAQMKSKGIITLHFNFHFCSKC